MKKLFLLFISLINIHTFISPLSSNEDSCSEGQTEPRMIPFYEAPYLVRKIWNGDLKAVIEYIENHIASLEMPHFGNTPLTVAVIDCDENLDIVKYLLSKGAKVNVTSQNNQTLLQQACTLEHLKLKPSFELIRLLLDHGADIYQKGHKNLNILEYLESNIKFWRDFPNYHRGYTEIYDFIKAYERDHLATMMGSSR